MAWGKGGSTNVVQVTTRGRRAISVPAVDVSYQPAVGTRTAHTVNYAKEDANTISSASRGKDQRLLSDITSRLANAQFTQPVTIKRQSRSHPRRTPSAPSSRRGSVSSVHSVPRKPKSLADEEFEIVFPNDLKAGRRAPCERRAYNREVFERSVSLPPAQPKREYGGPYNHGTRGFIDFGSPLLQVVSESSNPKPSSHATPWAPPRAPAYPDRRRYSFAFERPEDVYHLPARLEPTAYQKLMTPATPLNHVRRYSPIPRRNVYTYKGENDFRPMPVVRSFRAASEPRPTSKLTPSSSLAVRQARASLNRIERELGMNSSGLDDDAPYLDEPIITTTTTHVPLRSSSYGRTGFIRGNAPYSGSSYSSYPSRPPVGPSASRRHEIEARLETLVTPDFESSPATYSSLRSRTTEARDKLGQHGRMLDRYLEIPAGPPNEVPYEVEYKFQELAERMPQLLPRERREVSRATSLPPYRPANSPGPVNTYNDALRRTPFVPKVSDTRKRAREVLCRTKRDPHYFDY